MSQAILIPTTSPSVSLHHGRPATTSLEVAKFFGKRHDNVVRDIKQIMDNCPKELCALNFEETSSVIEMPNGGTRTELVIILHRDGFMLLVMGYTGKKAMQIKIAYIMAFNAMEAQILGNAPPQLSLDISTTADRKPLEKLVKVWASQAHMPHAQAWTQVNAHFNLGSITALPVLWLPDAIAFVEGKVDGLPKALPSAAPAAPVLNAHGRRVFPLTAKEEELLAELDRQVIKLHKELREVIFGIPFGLSYDLVSGRGVVHMGSPNWWVSTLAHQMVKDAVNYPGEHIPTYALPTSMLRDVLPALEA